MKKKDVSKKRRVASLKRSSKRGVRAKKNQEFKLDRQAKMNVEKALYKHKQDVYLEKLLSSRPR